MSDAQETLDDMRSALRSVIEVSRKQFAMIATTQIALLSVIKQLGASSLIGAVTAADRMREMISKILTTADGGLGEEVTILADRIAKFAPADPNVPQPPKFTKPKLVQ